MAAFATVAGFGGAAFGGAGFGPRPPDFSVRFLRAASSSSKSLGGGVVTDTFPPSGFSHPRCPAWSACRLNGIGNAGLFSSR